MKKFITLSILALASLTALAQDTPRQTALTQAVGDCQDFKKWTMDPALGIQQGQDVNVLFKYEHIGDRYDLADCVDKRSVSIMSWANAATPYGSLTTLEVLNVEDYANNHFPSQYMVHSYSEWVQALAHKDERQPRFTQYETCGDVHVEGTSCP
jgi:hypothetical protein